MNRPVLELIGREDTDNGAPWKVFDALPVRGSPSTQVDSREMRIPNGDSELEQCIRIHEMIHAKISPTTNDFKGWLSRGIASERALIIAEETRVNYLVKLLGYPIDTYLKDEREILDAALYASRSDWSNLVAGTVASVFTAAEQDWIRGSKKHSLTYSKQLKYIIDAVYEFWSDIHSRYEPKMATQAISEINSLDCPEYVTTKNNEVLFGERAALNEYGEPEYQSPNCGFRFTEELAEIIDTFLNAQDLMLSADVDNNIIDSLRQMDGGYGTVAPWDELRFSPIRAFQTVTGAINRKRTATNIGKNPRRISRLLTDPERRIFDRTKKIEGGIVLVDGSGSMRFDYKQIERIVLASPGATIAIYSASDEPRGHNQKNCPYNIFVVAKDGKMVSNKQLAGVVKELNGGNGVDMPVLKWALKMRKTNKQPIIWVTDGFLHQNPAEVSRATHLAVANKVMFANNMSATLELMNLLQKQSWVKTTLPLGMRDSVAKTYGIYGTIGEVNRRVAQKLSGSISVKK